MPGHPGLCPHHRPRPGRRVGDQFGLHRVPLRVQGRPAGPGAGRRLRRVHREGARPGRRSGRSGHRAAPSRGSRLGRDDRADAGVPAVARRVRRGVGSGRAERSAARPPGRGLRRDAPPHRRGHRRRRPRSPTGHGPVRGLVLHRRVGRLHGAVAARPRRHPERGGPAARCPPRARRSDPFRFRSVVPRAAGRRCPRQGTSPRPRARRAFD